MKAVYFTIMFVCMFLACGFFEGGGYFWGSVFASWFVALALIWNYRTKTEE